MKKERADVIAPKIKIHGQYSGKNASEENITAWPPVSFGIPNAVLRSALFGIQRERTGVGLIDDMILVYSGNIIRYTGPCLNQDDSLVWQIIIRAARQSLTPMGGLVQLSTNEILNSLERTDGGANFAWLKSCMERLTKAYISIETEVEETRSHLLIGYKVDKKTKKISVGISSLLYPLFASDLTDADVLRKTKLKSQLTRWLHDFYSSHSEPYNYSVDKIKELSRSNKQTSKFKKMIEESIEELKQSTPPLFSEKSHLNKETNLLHIYKATNSPGVPPVKKDTKHNEILNKKERTSSDINKIMKSRLMTREEVLELQDSSFYNYLENV